MSRPATASETYEFPNKPSFYLAYVGLCKEKHVPAILELIKNKNKLDFIADKIKVDQWLMILKSLDQDDSLELITIKSRKSTPLVDLDSEKKSFCSNTAPLISTKFIFAPLIQSLSECVKRNSVITSLSLEGLPLTANYIEMIANAISQNSSLKTLSFARSHIKDEGCNVICATVKHLKHIEKLNFSKCCLTTTAAVRISDLIKFQTINRCSEGWMHSLRYRDIDVDSIPGLKCLILNDNVFGDDGMNFITSSLKEDVWIKAIEVQNCELTDVGGKAILDCLKYNKTLVVFDASHNYKISNSIDKQIQMILGTEPDDYDTAPKTTNSQLREKIEFLEQRLQLEIFNRKKADDLNVQLHDNLIKYNNSVKEQTFEVPIGFKLVNEDILDSMCKEIDDLLQQKSYEEKDHYLVVKEIKEVKEINKIKDVKEVKAIKDVKDVKEIKEVKEIMEIKDVKEVKEIMEIKEIKEVKEINEVIGDREQSGSGDVPSVQPREQSGFGDVPSVKPNLTTELNTDSSINPKLEDEEGILTLDDIFNNPKPIYNKQNSDHTFYEGPISLDELDQQIFGNDKGNETEESKHLYLSDQYSTVC